jgi:hypothetical protein
VDVTTLISLIAAGVALVVTPLWLYLAWKGVKSISDIRDLLRRPPRSGD